MIIIDKLSYSSGLAHVSPEEKFAYAVLTLLVCVVSRSVAAAVTVLAVNGILNVKKGRVPFYLYLKYLMVPLIFLLLSTLASWSMYPKSRWMPMQSRWGSIM